MSAGAVRAPVVIPLRAPGTGLSKSQIDTYTRLELMSDTPNVEIYFTINGTKPIVSNNRKELSGGRTFKFFKPFTLPAGFQTIKALARSIETGSESNVVTKTFEVSKLKSPLLNDNDLLISDDYGFLHELKSIDAKQKKHIKSGRPDSDCFNQPIANGIDKIPKGSTDRAKYSKENQTILTKTQTTQSDLSKTKSELVESKWSTNSSNLMSRLQQKVNILRCPNCHHPRPINKNQQYCFHCGHVLPTIVYKSSPNGIVLEQIGVCQVCKANVPLNLSSCLVCESPLNSSRSNKNAKSAFSEYYMCTQCGSPNPTYIKSCLTCEARLATGPSNRFKLSHNNMPIPIVANGLNKFITCIYCKRENNVNARFCDWCSMQFPPVHSKAVINDGTRSTIPPKNATVPRSGAFIYCIKCDLPNPKEANYCSYCGLTVIPPPQNWGWLPKTCDELNKIKLVEALNATRLIKPRPVLANVSTQTVGLFYPSTTALRRMDNNNQQQQQQPQQGNRFGPDSTQLRDRQPILTAFSPGRGYWRKQVDHLFSHLKLYTNNNAEFRALIGQPRFGKLMKANMYQSNDQVQLNLVYALASTSLTKKCMSQDDLNSFWEKVDSNCKPNASMTRLSDGMESNDQLGAKNHTAYDEAKSPTNSNANHQNNFDCLDGPIGGGAAASDRTFRSNFSNSTTLLDATDDDNMFDSDFPTGSDRSIQKPKSKVLNKRQVKSIKRISSNEMLNDTKSNVNNNKALRTKRLDPHVLSKVSPGPNGLGMLMRDSKLTVMDRNLLQLLCQTTLNSNAVKRALEEGANPNCLTSAKETPLICAVHHGHLEAIQILLNSGAQINATGLSSGNTALHEAILLGRNGVDIAQLLLKLGASDKIENNHHETAHLLAVRSKCEPLMRMFAAHVGQKQLTDFTSNLPKPKDLSHHHDNL